MRRCVRFFTELDNDLMLIRVISLDILDYHLVTYVTGNNSGQD